MSKKNNKAYFKSIKNANEQLLPCPFCGGKARIVKHDFYMLSPTYGVICKDCGATSNQFFRTMGEAVAAWNTRISVPQEMTAREYIREYRRMYDFYFGKPATDGGINGCGDCPGRLNGKKNCIFSPTRDESSIPIIEKWAQEHPEERSEE